MKYLLKINTVRVLVGVAAMFTLMLVACGGADAPATPPAAAQLQPTATPIQQATPTAAATATPLPSGVTSARDSITLVVPEEPIGLNSLGTIGAALNASITRANLQDALTWQSGDDLRIVPTSGTESWEQVDSDTWRFQLRKGVKFHNGEPWNAQAALPSLASVGSATSEGGSINYTGAFDAEAVGEYTIDINCEDGCPIFPSASFFVNFEAPAWLADTSEEERVRQSIGFGPYKHVDWKPGVSITQEAYDGYVTVGDHFEFQKPFIKNVTWLWRGETVVIAAMVQTAEADIGWDIGVDTIGSLPPNMIKSGSSAESYALTTNTIWHPELKKKKVRQAMVHAINCAEMVEFLYSGYTTCRGNIIWPGIIGASERNTAPYKFDPELARQLLKEANYNPENKMTIVSRGTRIPKQLEVAESLQAFWTNVGINVDFRVVEPSIRSALTKCGVGKAVQEILEAAGKDPKVDKPTNADFQAALDKGGADCPTGDLIGNQPSNETLDFGRQVRYYMNCFAIRSLICDPSPGGIQDQIAPALSASGDERQRLLEALADRFHDDVLFIPLFDLPVFYAVNPKLNWEPRLDPNVRVSTMWFSK
jgi:peptide/nickel transport system substrate-binding protein